MKRCTTSVCLLVFVVAVHVVTTAAHAITIDTVPIGNPGNAPDTRYNPAGFGSVPYNYRIGKYEVTNAQYAEFLNGVDPTGANTLHLFNNPASIDVNGGINFNGAAANGSKYQLKPGRGNNPVMWVSWYDSIRFANWMHNGQGNGDTENGAYTLLGGEPTPSNGNSITRNADARWWLPSEDEWYKAAFHKNDGVTGNYWDYATSSDVVPYSDQPPGARRATQSNTANFFRNDSIANGYNDGYAVTGSPAYNAALNHLTNVGAYTLSASSYGTFDQAGNVGEWNETLINSSYRGINRGEFGLDAVTLHASSREYTDPRDESAWGFRVATIPEPSTLLLGAMASLGLLLRRRW